MMAELAILEGIRTHFTQRNYCFIWNLKEHLRFTGFTGQDLGKGLNYEEWHPSELLRNKRTILRPTLSH